MTVFLWRESLEVCKCSFGIYLGLFYITINCNKLFSNALLQNSSHLQHFYVQFFITTNYHCVQWYLIISQKVDNKMQLIIKKRMEWSLDNACFLHNSKLDCLHHFSSFSILYSVLQAKLFYLDRHLYNLSMNWKLPEFKL